MIFQLLLKEQNTKPCSGSPAARRVGVLVGDRPMGVVDLIAVRQVDDLLGEERLVLERSNDLVGDDVVDERRAHGAGIAEIAHLDGRRTIGQDAGPRILGVALQIDRDVDLRDRAAAPATSRSLCRCTSWK